MQAAQHKTLFLAAMLIVGIQPLAAHTHVAQNSRLGLETFKTSLHQEIELGSSLKALEIDASVRQTCVRSRSTGKERDAETGLDYFGARYISAAQGRFTSPDAFLPMVEFQPESGDDEDVEEARQKFNQYIGQPQNWNRYAYAFNNPLRFTDPDGNAVPLILYAAGTAIGSVIASPAGQRALISGSQYLSRHSSRVGPVLAQSGQYISNAAFQLGPVLRGRVIETLQGASEAFRNVRGIDNFANGVATSIKSLDVFAKSYQNLNTLSSTLSGYVQQLAGYSGGQIPGRIIQAGDIARRFCEWSCRRGT